MQGFQGIQGIKGVKGVRGFKGEMGMRGKELGTFNRETKWDFKKLQFYFITLFKVIGVKSV